MQWLMGYSNVIFFIVIAFVNIGLMIVKSVEKAKRKKIESKLASIPESDITQANDLKNRLDTVVEEADEERLHQIDVKMKDIKSRQDNNKIHDEGL